MKQIIALILAMAPFVAMAQMPKFGNVKMDEFLERPVNPVDSSANVYILYHDDVMSFNVVNGDVVRETQYKSRFLVLKEDGKDYANVIIRYFADKNKAQGQSDMVSGISAYAYNVVDGKIEKTSMESKYIFTEQVDEKHKETKFTIPNVRVGTIVEFKYSIMSKRFWDVPTWFAQRCYPVKYAHLSLTYPDFFEFSHFCKGYTAVQVKKTPVNVNFFSSVGTPPVSGVELDCKAENILALRDEGFVTNASIYATRMEFELLGITVPGSARRSFAQSWDDVRMNLKEHQKFGNYLKMKTPFLDVLNSMDLGSMNKIEKAHAVYSVLKNSIKWNKTFSCYAEHNPASRIEEGTGSNAEMNFLLLAMLKHVGVDCTPMLIKFRGNGPILRPTADDFSTFIVAFTGDDRELYFLDTASEYGDVNTIHPSLLGYGVLYDTTIVENPLPVYNLYEIGGNVNTIDVQGVITEEGELQAQRKVTYQGMQSLMFKSEYHEVDSAKYIEKLEARDDIKILSYSAKNAEGIGSQCREVVRFTQPLHSAGERIYFNPLGLPDEHSEHFTSETRICPVEFPFMQSTVLTSRISLPANYEIEEMPEPKTITMSDGSLEASVGFQLAGNVLVTVYQSSLNTTLIDPNQYAELRKFWTELLEMNTLNVVLKKKK